MADERKQIGRECKLYILTGGDTWTEFDLARDLTRPDARKESVADYRGSTEDKVKTGPRARGVNVNIITDPKDTAYAAALAAYNGNSVVQLRVLDGADDDADTTGWDGTFAIVSFEQGQPLDEFLTDDVVFKPAAGHDAPTAFEISE